MKKITKFLALALAAVMMMATLVSCAPNKDPDKALESLKAKDYVAYKETATAALSALFGSDSGLKCSVTGTKIVEDKDGNKKTELVTIFYYDSAKQAKTAFDKVKTESDKESKKNSNSDWQCAQSGAMIYYGTKAAIKAAN